MMKFTPPTPKQLKALQTSLTLTQSQMAEKAGYLPSKQANSGAWVADGAKWRKLTAPAESGTHRALSYTSFFHLAASLALSSDEMAKVKAKMNEINSL